MPSAAMLKDRYFGGAYAGAFQDATNAQTAMAQQDFKKTQGATIGGLAKIGGLRSGRAKTALNDITTNFGRQIGQIGAANAGQLAQLEASRAEGDANRGVQYAGIASNEKISGDRLAFDRTTSDRNFGYQQGRDAVSDQRYSQEQSYSHARDAVADARYTDQTQYARGRDAVGDARYADETQYARGVNQRDFDYTKSRDTVSDQRDQRNFDYTKGVDDRNFGYQQSRDSVADANNARDFNYRSSTDTRNFNESVRESDRAYNTDEARYQQQRADTTAAAKAKKKSGIWSAVGGVLGGVAGTLLGPAGTAIGSKIGGWVGDKIGGN